MILRIFARNFEAHFIVTGSYPGKTFHKEYFFPAGDMDTMILDTMSYEEFLMAVGEYDCFWLYKRIWQVMSTVDYFLVQYLETWYFLKLS